MSLNETKIHSVGHIKPSSFLFLYVVLHFCTSLHFFGLAYLLEQAGSDLSFLGLVNMFSLILLSTLLAATTLAAPTYQNSSGSCKPGFLNTVFNTGSANHASWPDPIWSTLTSYGIDNFSMVASIVVPCTQSTKLPSSNLHPATTQ